MPPDSSRLPAHRAMGGGSPSEHHHDQSMLPLAHSCPTRAPLSSGSAFLLGAPSMEVPGAP